VSATNRSLKDRVDDGSFRQDLFYRINAVVLELPALRDRPDDILLLARHFLAEARGPEGPSEISEEAEATLRGYAWPGNIRELRNVMERAALLGRGSTIRPSDLGSSLADGTRAATAPTDDGGLPSLDLAELETMAVRQALERTAWHQGQAAELLGVSDRTLHRKIRTLGLSRPD